MNEEKIKLLKEESARLKREVRKQVSGYILAGLGVVAGLAWNEAIKSLIEKLFPISQNGVQAKFFYAIVLTIVIVIVSMYIVRSSQSEEKK